MIVSWLQRGTLQDMSRKQEKFKWTKRMNSDLLECKRTANGLISSVDPPRNATGRKKGYIEVMADLWEERVRDTWG